MAAVKPKRHGPAMDMTAMCDVAFLLLTFFIMTTQFKSQESVTITTPSSVSKTIVEEKDIGTISVDPTGKYYFGITNPLERRPFIAKLNEKYNLGLTTTEQNTFTKMAEVGVSQKALKSYLSMSEGDRSRVALTGIPCDSVDTELVDWVKVYTETNPAGNLAIRGDVKTGYPFIKILFDEFGKAKINKFKLITKGES
jgi:biopolymer transport protein ExbD